MLKDSWDFLRSKYFFRTAGFILIFFILVFVLVNAGLKLYTFHGQKLLMPDYVGSHIDDAVVHAEERSFQIVILDSVHIVGTEGGMILNQTPDADAKVKKKRSVYVTVSKYNPDEISLDALPELYGKNYYRKSKELQRGFKIHTEVAGKLFDPGPEGYILMVVYDGDTIIDRSGRGNDIAIRKGGTLRCYISEQKGGRFAVPDLTCHTYQEALFLLETLNISLGSVSLSEDVTDMQSAFIYDQNPKFGDNTNIEMGSSIDISLVQEKPDLCVLREKKEEEGKDENGDEGIE